MKIHLLLLVTILISSASFAQQQDSLMANQSSRSKSYAIDSTQVQLYNFAKSQPFFMAGYMPEKFNQLRLGYGFDKGSYIPVQGASQVKTIAFFTDGKTNLGKFKVYGFFAYNKIVEDSTRWAHQTRLSSSAPYYFGAIKTNHYERNIYKIQGIIERDVMGIIPVTMAVDYRIGDHFSANDPRGAIKDFQLNLHPSIGYTFFNRLKAGLGYQYGYGSEEIKVGYKNSSYFENTVAEIYTNYEISGYGGAAILQLKSQLYYQNKQTRQFGNAYVDYQLGEHNNLIVSLKKGKEKEEFIRYYSDALGSNPLDSYEIETSSGNLLWYKTAKNYKILLALNYENKAGEDYNKELAGKNYTYNSEVYGAKATLTLNSGQQLTHNFHLGLQQEGEERKDGNNAIHVAYERVNLVTGWGINKQINTKHSFGAALSAAYRFKTNSTFSVPLENDNIFYKHVIYPDYQYNTSDNYSIGFNTDYTFPSYKGILTAVKAGITYTERSGAYTDLQRTLYNQAGDNRYSSNLSINLYF